MMIAEGDPPVAPLPSEDGDARRRRVLGVRVDDLGWAEVLDRLAGYVDARAAGDRPRLVVTPNPEIVVQAQADLALRSILELADLVTCDGVGLRWAAGRLGQPIRAVIPGSALTLELAQHLDARPAEAPGRRWFLLGAAPGVAEEAGERLRAEAPGLRVVGCFSGSPRPEDEPEIRARLAAAGPIDVLLLAYGTPAQERWLARNLYDLDVAVAMGVGGTFDFLAGRSPMPPAWVRRLGLIWLYRLLREPWRWRRQTRLLRFLALVARERLRAIGG